MLVRCDTSAVGRLPIIIGLGLVDALLDLYVDILRVNIVLVVFFGRPRRIVSMISVGGLVGRLGQAAAALHLRIVSLSGEQHVTILGLVTHLLARGADLEQALATHRLHLGRALR